MSEIQWQTPKQVAADPRYSILGNADWFLKQLRKGNLRGSQINGRWYIPEGAVTEMLEAGTNDTRKRRKRAQS
jgi:hypothetical protein